MTAAAGRPVPRTPPPPAPAPQPAPARRPSSSTSRPRLRPSLPTGRGLWGRERPTSTAAGVVLGLLAWGWIALPLLRGGPTEVRNTLRAKFFNKGPDGKWLP